MLGLTVKSNMNKLSKKKSPDLNATNTAFFIHKLHFHDPTNTSHPLS